MQKELDLSCFSYLAIARVLGIKKYPKPNYGAEVLDVIDTLAADAPMVAVAASHIGLKVGLIANSIGSDPAGDEIMSRFERNDVTTSIKKDPNIKTPFIVVLSDQGGNREWFPYIPRAESDLRRIKLDLIKRSTLAYIDYYEIIRKSSQRAIDFAAKNKISSFINLGGSPFTPEVADLLRKKDVAVIQTNLEENDAQNAVPLAQSMFTSIKPEVAIVTLGDKGAVAVNSKETIGVSAYHLKIRHLHGAGAAFSAGYALGYLREWELEKSLRFACALGSMNCTVETGFDVFSQEDVEKIAKVGKQW